MMRLAVLISCSLLVAAPAAAAELLVRLPREPGSLRLAQDLGGDLWSVDESGAVLLVDDAALERLRTAGILAEIVGAAPLPPPQDAGMYRTADEALARLHELADAGAGTLLELGESVEGAPILALEVGRGDVEILLDGLHHAREWIALEVPLRILEALVEGDGVDPQVTWVLDHTRIVVLPLLNPDGYRYSHEHKYTWRKNRSHNADGTRGVDLNRNYDRNHCGVGSSTDTNDETYCGPAPFSEPETRALRDLVLARDFQASVSYHNFSQYIMYPWGDVHEVPPDAEEFWQIVFAMAEQIESVHGKRYRPMQSDEMYLATGTQTDWFYQETGELGLTIELRPRASDVGTAFALPGEEIAPTFEENWAAIRWLFIHLAAAASDGDWDGDGVADRDDLCPGLADPEQADEDVDGVGDACDPFVADRQGPATPQNLRLVEQGVGWVELAWDPVVDRGGSGLDRYELRRSSRAVGNTEETSLRDEGGTPGRTYIYQVRCWDGAGNRSLDSVPLEVTICDADPCGDAPEPEPDAEAEPEAASEPDAADGDETTEAAELVEGPEVATEADASPAETPGGSGGCECAATPGRSTPAWVLILAGVLARRRRRSGSR